MEADRPAGRTRRRLMVRLTWRDELATLLVAAAGLVAFLWLSGLALTGMSPRAVGAIVFALGFAACTSDKLEMANVYGAEGHRRAPMAYVVFASLLGLAALVAGLLTLVTGSETMLVTLVAAMVALWAITTIRHATEGRRRRGANAPLRGV
jgi:hypothetical protein